MITSDIMNQLVPLDRGLGDLGEVATFDSLNSQCVWEPNTNDESEYGIPTVIKCELASVDIDDPSVIKSINDTEMSLTGEYGLSTFDQLSYEFKDIETNEIFKESGWPPTDPRVKYMFKLHQDPRDNRDVNYFVDFIIEFDMSSLSDPLETIIATTNPLTYNLYVVDDYAYRRDRITFNHTVRNYSFRKLASELKMVLEAGSQNGD